MVQSLQLSLHWNLNRDTLCFVIFIVVTQTYVFLNILFADFHVTLNG